MRYTYWVYARKYLQILPKKYFNAEGYTEGILPSRAWLNELDRFLYEVFLQDNIMGRITLDEKELENELKFLIDGENFFYQKEWNVPEDIKGERWSAKDKGAEGAEPLSGGV
jgi:hypothetical protein